MSYSTLPIVGAFYRPPAKVVCDSLPVGTPLFLSAEPDNAFDPNAVAVWVVSADIPASAHRVLEAELPKFGFDLDTFLAQEQWHLGYMPKEFAKQLKDAEIVKNDEIIPVTFAVGNDGKSRVRFAEPVL